jgi:hypothetical protein
MVMSDNDPTFAQTEEWDGLIAGAGAPDYCERCHRWHEGDCADRRPATTKAPFPMRISTTTIEAFRLFMQPSRTG